MATKSKTKPVRKVKVKAKRKSATVRGKRRKPEAYVNEKKMAVVVEKILTAAPDNSMTWEELREVVPSRVRLNKSDRAKLPSRPNEESWMQILRNLGAHKHNGFKVLKGGVLKLDVRKSAMKAKRPAKRPAEQPQTQQEAQSEAA